VFFFTGQGPQRRQAIVGLSKPFVSPAVIVIHFSNNFLLLQQLSRTTKTAALNTKQVKNKLLCIEDDVDLSKLIAEIMEYEQYEVITDNGKSLPKILAEHGIGLILMDERLYWTTGSSLCMELKKNPETAGIPVIMISAAQNIKDISKSCGADGFIKKPFDLYEALDVVARHFVKN